METEEYREIRGMVARMLRNTAFIDHITAVLVDAVTSDFIESVDRIIKEGIEPWIVNRGK